jgi:fused signal recognition particle receptor
MDIESFVAAVSQVDPLIYCGVAIFLIILLKIISKPVDSDEPAQSLTQKEQEAPVQSFKEEPQVEQHLEATQPIVQADPAEEVNETVEQLQPIRNKLTKTRTGLLASLKGIFRSAPSISKDDLEELKYMLVSSDIGIKTTELLIKELQESLSKDEQITEDLLIEKLKNQIQQDLFVQTESVLETITPGQYDSPRIVMVVGVNGVGKTTSTAKLAARLKSKGVSVLLVAADTFRAAAVKQLQTWGERLDIQVVSGPQDCKPQTVVFDAMKVASENKFDVILIDTAGRLNTKTSLMQELTGVRNAVERHSSEGIHEVLLVVDGTTGQNAVSQAKEFHSAATLTGVIITKLDGTAKGGVVVAVKNEINVPIRYVGVGESALDLRPFNIEEFVDALFSGEEKELATSSAHAEVRKRRRRAA